MHQETFDAFGFGEMSQEEKSPSCEAIFKPIIWAGTPDDEREAHARLGLAASPACSARSGIHENVVLMGDAAATAHFSIGSGTKLALESRSRWPIILHSRTDDGRGLRPL
jgi:anthraniloyl-CoA monooxygenase